METSTPLPLPPEIRVEPLSPEGLRYVLPRRPLGGYRWLAVLPLAFSLIGLTFAWDWFAPLVRMQMRWPFVIFGAFGALFIGGSVIVPLVLAAAMLWGHSSIEIRGGRLSIAERIWKFGWRRKQPLASVRRFEISGLNDPDAAHGGTVASPSRYAAIRIENDRGRSRWAAIGYPRDWLLPLAHELARQVRAAQPQLSDLSAPEPQIHLVEVVEPRGPVQRFVQPPGSLIVMTEQPGSLTFEVPPAGIKRGTAGMFAFACLWLGFMAVFTVLVICVCRTQQPPPDKAFIFIFFSFVSLFWLVGIALMLWALQMARRRTAIAVADGRCLVAQTGLFGEKKQIWEAGELMAVQVGSSGVEINDVPVMELQFIPCAGGKFGVLSARDVPELEWLATRLSQALGLVPTRAGAVVLADIDQKPSKSDVLYEQSPERLTLSIPRSRLSSGPLLSWAFAVFWNGGNAVVATPFVLEARQNGFGESLFPLAMMSLFALVGIALIGGAIHITIRRAEIAFAAGQLLVVQFGLFGKRRRQWAAEELAAIRAAVSDTTMNNQRLMQLQIVPVSGKTVQLLTGRGDQELAWIATLLRRALKLPAETEKERAAYPRSASGIQARSAGPV